jgi:ATP phosphoribosyltransferase
MEMNEKRDRILQLVMLLQSVLDARNRVMVEVNVTVDALEALAASLPCMREPTISRLHGDKGYAIKVAAPRAGLPGMIARIKALGGTDIVVSQISQIIP